MSVFLCYFCDSLMEWPRECGWCGGWFCTSCVDAASHGCDEAARECERFDDDEASA